MINLLNHATESEIEYRFRDNLHPVAVFFENEGPNKVTLSNNEVIESSCLNCASKSCLYFNHSVHSDIVDVVFSKDVCPTNSIFLDERDQVVIDEESCIGCGLCAIRCRTGAIYIADNIAVIHRDSMHLVEGKLPEDGIRYDGYLIDNVEERTMKIIATIHENKKSSVIMTNLFKSCLMVLGYKVVKPRVGDVNLRMDLIVDSDDCLYLVEVDNIGSPDTVRDIIDDVAIFCDKQSKDLGSVAGVSCLLEFPNRRSEYYELISDAEKVLKFNIYSLSLGVIFSVLFNRKQLDITHFKVNDKQYSCRSALEHMLGKNCFFNQKSSLIEAAK